MSKLSREVHIDAPPDEVYSVLADPSRLEQWVTIQESLDEAPRGDLVPGARLVQRLKVAGQRFQVAWTVSEAKRPSLIVWDGHGPLGTRAQATYRLAPNERGTTFSYTNEYILPGGAMGRFAGRVLGATSGREADRSLQQLKKLIERG